MLYLELYRHVCSESSQPVGQAVVSAYNYQQSSIPIAKSHMTLAERKRQEWNKQAGTQLLFFLLWSYILCVCDQCF